MKYLIETTGKFGLVDYSATPPAVIPSQRPCVVEGTNFITNRQHMTQIRILGDLKDEATDEEFKKYWDEAKGDSEFAVSSFLSGFGAEVLPAKRSNKELKLADLSLEEFPPAPKGKK